MTNILKICQHWMAGAPRGHTHLISCDNSVALPGENQKTFDRKIIVRGIKIFANVCQRKTQFLCEKINDKKEIFANAATFEFSLVLSGQNNSILCMPQQSFETVVGRE